MVRTNSDSEPKKNGRTYAFLVVLVGAALGLLVASQGAAALPDDSDAPEGTAVGTGHWNWSSGGAFEPMSERAVLDDLSWWTDDDGNLHFTYTTRSQSPAEVTRVECKDGRGTLAHPRPTNAEVPLRARPPHPVAEVATSPVNDQLEALGAPQEAETPYANVLTYELDTCTVIGVLPHEHDQGGNTERPHRKGVAHLMGAGNVCSDPMGLVCRDFVIKGRFDLKTLDHKGSIPWTQDGERGLLTHLSFGYGYGDWRWVTEANVSDGRVSAYIPGVGRPSCPSGDSFRCPLTYAPTIREKALSDVVYWHQERLKDGETYTRFYYRYQDRLHTRAESPRAPQDTDPTYRVTCRNGDGALSLGPMAVDGKCDMRPPSGCTSDFTLPMTLWFEGDAVSASDTTVTLHGYADAKVNRQYVDINPDTRRIARRCVY